MTTDSFNSTNLNKQAAEAGHTVEDCGRHLGKVHFARRFARLSVPGPVGGQRPTGEQASARLVKQLPSASKAGPWLYDELARTRRGFPVAGSSWTSHPSSRSCGLSATPWKVAHGKEAPFTEPGITIVHDALLQHKQQLAPPPHLVLARRAAVDGIANDCYEPRAVARVRLHDWVTGQCGASICHTRHGGLCHASTCLCGSKRCRERLGECLERIKYSIEDTAEHLGSIAGGRCTSGQ
eukprot:SM000054S18069  [mRNA]  locus=s54:186387:189394:- [translate_table: standard]